MLKSMILAILLSGHFGGVVAAEDSARPESASIAWLRAVAHELRELRRELVADRLERREQEIQALKDELDRARLERQDAEAVQRAQAQDLLGLDQRIGDAATSAEQRAELERIRAELTASHQNERPNPIQKETTIGDRLRREEDRLAALRALAQSLGTPSTGSRH
jgi:hypothetical protein